VHGLNAGDGDGMAFVDEVGSESLRAGHLGGPGISVPEMAEGGVDREVHR
jgi:hypothetical protein